MSLRTSPIEFDLWGNDDYDRVQERIAKAESAGVPWCVHCGRKLNPTRAWTVHPINGGGVLLHPDDEAKYVPDGGDMGCWDLGPECAKKVPIEYRTKMETP